MTKQEIQEFIERMQEAVEMMADILVTATLAANK